jgi:hypothetical protein
MSSIIGGQFISISSLGMGLFQTGKFSSGVGGLVVDLVSAPIPPGEYKLELSTVVGGLEIYLPRYVEFTIDSSSIIGGQDVHNGLGWWDSLVGKVSSALKLSDTIPEHAVAPLDPTRPVKIRLLLNTGVGGVDIYRLDTE